MCVCVVFLEICKVGKPSKVLKKEWKNGTYELEGGFCDIFRCDIKYVEAGIDPLLRVKAHL